MFHNEREEALDVGEIAAMRVRIPPGEWKFDPNISDNCNDSE